MKKESAIQNEITAQKLAIQKLKREIFGIDKTYKSAYIKEFMAEFRTYRRIVTMERIIRAAADSDIVYFGDYHPLDASQDLLLRLMRELTAYGRKVVLAMEMLYTHQQPSLDRWMKGTIPETEFLDEIEYYSEWGFNWKSFRRIFELAKDPFIPIFGIDEEPRDQLRFIRKRDRLIARRIAMIRRFFPGYLILVMIGESHLASGHLPAEVRARYGDAYHEIIVVQNIEAIYWQLLARGKEDADAVLIDSARYCIFNTSPILKYESYRDIIDAWIGGATDEKWTQAFEGMVGDILLFLGENKESVKVTVREGWRESINIVFPEVQCRKTYKAFAVHLRSRGVSQLGTFAGIEYLRQHGVLYLPAINEFLVVRFESFHVLREAARFVVWALRDRVGIRSRTGAEAKDRFYSFVLEEALIHFGSKIVNPKQDCMETDPVLRSIDARGVVRCALPRLSMRETREVAGFVKYHFKRDRKLNGCLRVTDKLEKIYRLGVKRRWFIVRTLGSTLGEALYHAYHDGRFSQEEIIDLFRERFEISGSSCERYISLVRRTSPYRGYGGSHQKPAFYRR